jgi:hypothetical protein
MEPGMRAELHARYPQHMEIIEKLTRPYSGRNHNRFSQSSLFSKKRGYRPASDVWVYDLEGFVGGKDPVGALDKIAGA